MPRTHSELISRASRTELLDAEPHSLLDAPADLANLQPALVRRPFAVQASLVLVDLCRLPAACTGAAG